MCTVTFIPSADTLFLTSNRDEAVLRAPALPPAKQLFRSGLIVFPKDREAGGTWAAAHENGNAMVLLNGAFERHLHQQPYRESRGLIFLKIFDSNAPATRFNSTDLNGIAPFTLVIWQEPGLWEARWDGQEKHLREMDAKASHIWSSATLYDADVRERRAAWFRDWLAGDPGLTGEQIRRFHRFGGSGDKRNDLRINRDGKLLTVSITAISLSAGRTGMHYEDLLTNEHSFQELVVRKPVKEQR